MKSIAYLNIYLSKTYYLSAVIFYIIITIVFAYNLCLYLYFCIKQMPKYYAFNFDPNYSKLNTHPLDGSVILNIRGYMAVLHPKLS